MQGELEDKKARLDIASRGAAELEAIKAEHSATLAQLKERHREEMYMLQASTLLKQNPYPPPPPFTSETPHFYLLYCEVKALVKNRPHRADKTISATPQLPALPTCAKDEGENRYIGLSSTLPTITQPMHSTTDSLHLVQFLARYVDTCRIPAK